MSTMFLLLPSEEPIQILITNGSGMRWFSILVVFCGRQILQSAGQDSIQSLDHEVHITVNFGTT